MDLKTLQKICFSLFLMTFMVFGAFAANPTQTYDDVTPNDWFYDTVMDLTKEGVVNGVGNNRFAPNRSVTTNEFVLMLLRMDTSSNGTTANLYN